MNILDIRRPSLTRAVTMPEYTHTEGLWFIPSRAMPGFNVRVWRTDGGTGPMPTSDRTFIANRVWRKGEYINVRCQWHATDTSYEIMVVTMPTIHEFRPEDELRP